MVALSGSYSRTSWPAVRSTSGIALQCKCHLEHHPQGVSKHQVPRSCENPMLGKDRRKRTGIDKLAIKFPSRAESYALICLLAQVPTTRTGRPLSKVARLELSREPGNMGTPTASAGPNRVNLEIRDATTGFAALLNDDLAQARVIFASKPDSVFHSLGAALITFLEATLGQEEKDLGGVSDSAPHMDLHVRLTLL